MGKKSLRFSCECSKQLKIWILQGGQAEDERSGPPDEPESETCSLTECSWYISWRDYAGGQREGDWRCAGMRRCALLPPDRSRSAARQPQQGKN